MKKLLLLTFLFLGAATAFSQDFTYTDEQHVIWNVAAENYDASHIEIATDQPEDILYKWELVTNTMPSSWSYSLCDYGGCAIGIPSNGTMDPITAAQAQNGVRGFFTLNLTVGQNFGTGLVEIYVYDADDYYRGDTVSWSITWDGNSAGLKELSADPVLVYPNPSTGLVSIDQGTNILSSVSVISITGSEVYQMEAVNGTVSTLDLSSLDKGVYYIRMRLDNGEIRNQEIVLH